MTTIGLLHPGAMGAAVGDLAVAAGAEVRWLPAGRGAATHARAARFVPVEDVSDCDLIISVCPPAAALDLAHQVADSGFTGAYLEANAISPARAARIAEFLGAYGITVADGGIIGGPPRHPGTRLYLSGPASPFHDLFAGTLLEPITLPGPVGQASAIKLAFASYNKITQVAAAQAAALADGYGVRAELLELTAQVLPGTPMGQPERLSATGAKAWRWAPEFREIAAASEAIGLSGELPAAAAKILDRWAACKDSDTVTLDDLIAALAGD